MGRCKKQTKNLKTLNEMPNSRKMLRKLQRKEQKAKRNASYRKKCTDISKKALMRSTENRINIREAIKSTKCVAITHQNIKKTKQADLVEDRIIKKLEKNLKLRKHKGKSIPKMFVIDGLDYVLEACNITEAEPISDLELVTEKGKNSDFESVSHKENTENYFRECLHYSEKPMQEQKKKLRVGKKNEASASTKLKEDNENLKANKDKQKKAMQESALKISVEMACFNFQNIEVASESKHNQNVVAQETEILQKQIKGLLNRLAEDNMKGIADKFEELYMSHTHNTMNRIFVRVLIESLVRHIATPEKLIMIHAVFIATLHANVGDAVGAFILEALAKKFIDLLEHQKEEDKQLDNITILLCHLCNFKVMNATTMYDILKKLAETFMEKELELIILILKTVGINLRKEDPEAFKGFMFMVQKKAQEFSVLSISNRLKFLCDILISVKNNNVIKIPGYDPSHSERLKKLLKDIVRENVPQLRVSLKDLLASEKRGRWWETSSVTVGNRAESCETLHDNKFIQLAKKQGMNTELRQNTFCVLMTAEDFLDAYGKLITMKVRHGQEREVIYVTMHCCLQERVFNKFYGYVTKQLCEFDRKFRMAVYYTIWDKLKLLQTMTDLQRHNLARFLSSLIMQKCLNLSVLKVLDFATLSKVHISFLRQVLSEVLLVDSEETLREIFKSITLSEKLVTFCKSLHLFLCHFLKHNKKAINRITMAIDLLAVSNSKLRYQM